MDKNEILHNVCQQMYEMIKTNNPELQLSEERFRELCSDEGIPVIIKKKT